MGVRRERVKSQPDSGRSEDVGGLSGRVLGMYPVFDFADTRTGKHTGVAYS
jgi:hypothetical protein